MPTCRAPRKALLTAHSRTPPLLSHWGHGCGAPAAGRIRMSHTHGCWDDAHTAVLEHPTCAAFRRRGHTPNQRRREVRALLLVHGGLHVLLSDAQHARWWQCCILGLALRSLLCCCLQCCPGSVAAACLGQSSSCAPWACTPAPPPTLSLLSACLPPMHPLQMRLPAQACMPTSCLLRIISPADSPAASVQYDVAPGARIAARLLPAGRRSPQRACRAASPPITEMGRLPHLFARRGGH